jgi:hypothetical protein
MKRNKELELIYEGMVSEDVTIEEAKESVLRPYWDDIMAINDLDTLKQRFEEIVRKVKLPPDTKGKMLVNIRNLDSLEKGQKYFSDSAFAGEGMRVV